MKSIKNFLESKVFAFNSLDKREMQSVCGSGVIFWDPVTKTLRYKSEG